MSRRDFIAGYIAGRRLRASVYTWNDSGGDFYTEPMQGKAGAYYILAVERDGGEWRGMIYSSDDDVCKNLGTFYSEQEAKDAVEKAFDGGKYKKHPAY